MSSTEPKKISIDSASIIDLKAELLKKQEEYKLKRFERTKQTEYEINSTLLGKKSQVWGKKKNEKAAERNEQQKPETPNQSDETVGNEEEQLLQKSKLMLESKAKYYEDLVKGSARPEQGDEEVFLVDFDKKAYEKRREDDDDDDFLDSKYAAINFSYDDGQARVSDKKLNIRETTNEEDYKEKLREKWEEETRINAEKGDIHYADILYDEARERGVGHFQFSTRDEERKKQMKYFDELKNEATKSRLSVQQEKKTRQELLKERLRKTKQKRLLKEGYSLEDIESMFQAEDEAEMEVVAEQVKEREEEDAEDREKEEKAKERKKSLPVLSRDWDKPKLKEPMWNKIVENIRQERRSEFAPPTAYNKNKQQKGTAKKQKTTSQQATSSAYNMVPPPFVPPPLPFMMPPPSFIPFPPTDFSMPPPPIFQIPKQADIPLPENTESPL